MRVSGFILVLSGCIGALVASCDERGARRDPSVEGPLRVFAAASLGDVVAELAEHFERESGVRVVVSFGGSATLRRQIELGAPADVFVSADARQVRMLERGGLVALRQSAAARPGDVPHPSGSHPSALLEGGPPLVRRVAGNRLVIAVSTGSDVAIESPTGLGDSRVRRIAIANPEYAPAGRYAREALTRCGVWAHVESKLVLTENVRHAAMHIRSGAVEAAIVYGSDLRGASGLRSAYWFNAAAHEPIEYVAAVPARSTRVEVAGRFLEFVSAPERGAVWRAHGFVGAGPGEAGN